jgi:hypothetical protein
MSDTPKTNQPCPHMWAFRNLELHIGQPDTDVYYCQRCLELRRVPRNREEPEEIKLREAEK